MVILQFAIACCRVQIIREFAFDAIVILSLRAMSQNQPYVPSSPPCGATAWTLSRARVTAPLTAEVYCRALVAFLVRHFLCALQPIGFHTYDKMKVTIKEWNAVAAWRWDMPDDDVCGICRNPYDSTCSKCKFPGDECPLRKMTLSVMLFK